MSKSGKKGKKKGTVLSLESFLGGTPTGGVGTIQVVKKISNIDGDDSDESSGTSTPMVFQLPTAPKAQRIFDDNQIPHVPPFIARLNNLPFDANEDDIREFFGNTPIVSLRLPREDGDTGRVRGFGNIEFENRDDLIHFLSLPDPTIKGRRIRIEEQHENDQQNSGQRMNRRGYSGFGNSAEDRESTNWRRDGGGGAGTSTAERDYDSTSRGYGYQSGFNRSNNSNSYSSSNWRQDSDTRSYANRETSGGNGGLWRSGNRPSSGDFTSWRDKRKNSEGDGNQHSDFTGRGNSSSPEERSWRTQNNDSRSWRNGHNEQRREYGTQNRTYDPRERSVSENEESADARPRLNLQPRTLPLPEIIVKVDFSTRSENAASPQVSDSLTGAEVNEMAALAEGPENADDHPEGAKTPEAAQDN